MLTWKYEVQNNKFIILNKFEKDLDEIIQFIIINNINEIFYHSYFDKIELLNFTDNPIKIISYLQISKVDKLMWQIQNLNNLPINLKSLNLEKSPLKFLKLSNLPVELKQLSLPIEYDFELDNLPMRLELLTITTNNNIQYNLCYLPESLRELSINGFHQCMDFSNLPIGLEKFEINGPRIISLMESRNDNFQTLLSNLPRGLKILYLPYQEISLPIDNIPPKLQELRIPLNYNKKKLISNIFKTDTSEPNMIKKLCIGHNLLVPNGCDLLFSLNFDVIPDFVEEILFADNFNENISYLPSNLKKICFGHIFNKRIGQSIIPNSVEELVFGHSYNHPLLEYPSNLKVLKFGRNFTHNLTNLPIGLIELELGKKFYGKLVLPKGLEILKFDIICDFFQDLTLPNTIKILELSNYYLGGLTNLPKSLESIKYNPFLGKNNKITDLLILNNYQGEIKYIGKLKNS